MKNVLKDKKGGDVFAVRYDNDSMINANIPRGAVVLVQKQRTAQNGDIILAAHGGGVYIRYYQENDGEKYLIPANNAFLPVVVKAADNFAILGKVIEIRLGVA